MYLSFVPYLAFDVLVLALLCPLSECSERSVGGALQKLRTPGRAFNQLIAPLLDLVRLNVKSSTSSISVFSPLIAATAASL